MKQLVLFSALCILLFSCNKKKVFDGPNQYADDFESYSVISDLLQPNDALWSFTQLTRTENFLEVDTLFGHSGNESVHCYATAGADGNASKCSVAKQYMAFWEGETVHATCWYFIQGTNDLSWLFLMDLEEQTAVGAGPGMRLAMVNDQLRVEYKFNQDDIVQASGQELAFPRNEWVKVDWEIKLSRKKKGTVKVWQNDQLIIDASKKVTLPKDLLYFQQGTKGMYSSFEIGITANSADNNLHLWIDDARIEKVN